MTNQQLQDTIARLAAENDALRTELKAAAAEPTRAIATEPMAASQAAMSLPGQSHPVKRGRGWGWTVLATVLILIGSILAPVAIIANWAKAELADTDTFVATFAPLAKDAGVRAFVTDEVVTAINNQVDIPSLTSDVFDSIAGLGLGPVATRTLDALKAPAAAGIQNLMRSTVSNFISSKQFATIWEQTLRTTHDQLIATMQNDSSSAISIGKNGEISLQLGPVISQVKELLVKQGMTFAENIPVINRSIVVAQSDAIGPIQVGYALTIGVGAWLPWIALACLVLGVAVARRRSRALIGAAVGLGLAMALLAIGLGVGRVIFVGTISQSVMSPKVAGTLFDQVIAFMQSSAIAVAVLALTVAIVGWLAGPFRFPRRLREAGASGAATVRAMGDRHGLSTGRTGVWIYRQRLLLRVVIALIGAVIVLFVRPLTPGLIIWTAVICALVIGVLAVLGRPAADAEADATADADADADATAAAAAAVTAAADADAAARVGP
ncbi:MAG: hypothetical protein ABI310_07685 [Microbacteriaceae bacterium]